MEKINANAKKILKGLRDKSMWLTMEDGSETLVGWLSKVTLCKGSGIATVTLDDDLVPLSFCAWRPVYTVSAVQYFVHEICFFHPYV